MEAPRLRLCQQQRPQPLDPESDRAETIVCCVTVWVLLLLPIAGVLIGLLLSNPEIFQAHSPMVHVASVSLSLSSEQSLWSRSVIIGNWSAALSVRNRSRRRRLGWDHAQVMLFYGREFVAGTFVERFSVAPKGNGTLETGVTAFSRDVGEWAARAMGRDGGDGGVMELEVRLLHHRDGRRYWSGWDNFDCRGLKVGFSSQNQSQVGLFLSGSPHKCK